jgi:DNA end-binding protein Ku
MKALWHGYIALGQLGIPVRLYSATTSQRPEFHLLHAEDGSPVERVLKCAHEDKEIEYSETVRAAEPVPGKYVTFTKQELERAGPYSTKVIQVTQFTEPAAIDPIHYEKPYYVAPGKGGERAYALLRDVLADSDKVAITQIVIRGNEHIAALGPHQDLLVLHQLRYATEILPRTSLKTRALPKPSPTERAALKAVVEQFSDRLYISDYHDEHTEALRELAERKAKGLPKPRRERTEATATPEDEIIQTLKSSLRKPAQIEA